MTSFRNVFSGVFQIQSVFRCRVPSEHLKSMFYCWCIHLNVV